jgi:hypothetical protein
MQLTPLPKWLSQQFELSVRGREVKELYLFEQDLKADAKMLKIFDTCFCRAGFKNSVVEGITVIAVTQQLVRSLFLSEDPFSFLSTLPNLVFIYL